MFMQADTAVGDNVSDEVAALQVRARASQFGFAT
jgi:hypothetical protein